MANVDAGNEAEAAPKKPAKSRPVNVERDPGMPSRLVLSAILVGLFLVLTGIALSIAAVTFIYNEKALLLGQLTACVGFGIVLAAFGTRAQGTWRNWALAGAGASAVALFLVLTQSPTGSSPSFQKLGHIQGEFDQVANVQIRDVEPFFIRKESNSLLHFIILDKQFRTNWIDVTIETTEKGPGKERFRMTSEATIIEQYLRNPNTVIKWQFDYATRKIKDGNKILFEERDPSERQFGERPRPNASFLHLFAPIGAAYAARLDTRTLIEGLKSDEPSVRRNARDGLIALGPAAVTPMMSTLRRTPSEYRLRVGVIYCLAEMLRAKVDRTALIGVLTDEDIRLLVNAASFDEDTTVRLEATEFLFYLKDPRAAQASLDAAKVGRDDRGTYNSVLILKSAQEALKQPEQKRILQELNAIQFSNEEVKKLVGSIKAAD
jgi:hypothetical protein